MRLNGMIDRLSRGQTTLSLFAPMVPEIAVELQTSPYHGLVFEGEHLGWDMKAMRDSFQYLLNRRMILDQGSPAPTLTPLVRLPSNGCEQNQFLAKQALDVGAYGIVWPHISNADEAYNAVAACRYARLPDKPVFEPRGIRGDGPAQAARYWGVTQQDYYRRADVWPLVPEGEILVVIQIEDMEGIENLPDILKRVAGIGAVLIGEGDLSQELGVPRQTEHPSVLEAMARVVRTCDEHGVVVGHPHVSTKNVDRVLAEGFRFLMSSAPRNFGPAEAILKSAKGV